MSSTYQAGEAGVERSLAEMVVQAMGIDFEFVSVAVLGKRVLLHGTAPSYVAKERAAQLVRDAGYTEVDNCLRVVPGVPAWH